VCEAYSGETGFAYLAAKRNNRCGTKVAFLIDMTNVPNKTAWRSPSLRGRVALLAGTVVILLTATLLILIGVLRNSQAELVARSNKHLEAVARSMAEVYQNRTNRNISLAQAMPLPPPPPPRPAPPPASPEAAPPPRLPAELHGPGPASAAEKALEVMTSSVLHDETGIEGGYFRPSDQRLVGYAFPTHEGPGDPAALPARETPSIVAVASAAVEQNKLQQNSFFGSHDVVLFTAIPVCETKACSGGPQGAGWLMQRLPGAEAGRKRALLWSAFGFATVACITVILAFLVLTQVDQGTQAVLDRLTRMESDLSEEEHPKSVRLAEYHRVLDGLDRLGGTLRTQMARERELQSRLRQNERLAAIGQLAAGVAHELRNPLATIRLRSQMAQRRTTDASVAQAAGVILSEVDRLDAIIERLLNFSRPIRLHLAPVDMAELCRSAISRWHARHPRTGFAYEGEESVATTADLARLEQVIDNALENAVHQLEETKAAAPAVLLACSRSGGAITLEIRDNGGGFTPEALQSAVEPFFTTRAKGTGLGLAITNEIVTALGGTLSIRNENNGAVVRIQLPVPTEDR
jgi:signal transduction histidine kinase